MTHLRLRTLASGRRQPAVFVIDGTRSIALNSSVIVIEHDRFLSVNSRLTPAVCVIEQETLHRGISDDSMSSNTIDSSASTAG